MCERRVYRAGHADRRYPETGVYSMVSTTAGEGFEDMDMCEGGSVSMLEAVGVSSHT
jgi:hypothetical protein